MIALPAVADLFKSTFEDPLKKLLQPAGVMPALVFVGLNLTAIYPTLVEKKIGFATTFNDLDGPWQLGIIAVTIVVLGYVVLAFSSSVLSIAAGEGWQNSLLRPVLLWHQHRNREKLAKRPAELGPQARARDYELKARFPPGIAELAPTALGNALTAIGDGIFDSYGLDLSGTWTQMRTAVRKEDKDFVDEIDDAQVGFLSLLNLAAVLVIFALEGLLLALLLDTSSFWIPAVVSLVAAYIAYRGAVGRVASWGDQVAAAYDLYRPKFRELLGVGKPLTASFERRQSQALSAALLWDNGNQSYTTAEQPEISFLPSPSLTASLISSEASPAKTSQETSRSEVRRVFDYLISVEATDKAAKDVAGVIEVIDRRLPTRISHEPMAQVGPPSFSPEIRRRFDVGLRDSLAWTVGKLDGGKAYVLAYRLDWVVSIDVDGPVVASSVAIVEGATDLAGLVLVMAEMAMSDPGDCTLAMRDDRLPPETALRGRYRQGDAIQQLLVTREGGHWVFTGNLPKGEGRLEVRRADE